MRYFVVIISVFFFSCRNLETHQLNYYELVYKAEYLFIKGDTKSALDYYNRAFDLDFNLYSKDLFNAILVSRELSIDYSDIINKLDSLGVSTDYLDCVLVKNGDNKLCDKYVQNNFQRPDSFRNFIDSLFEIDQYWRVLDFEEDNTGYNDYREEITDIDDTNGELILAYLIENGYPSECDQGFEYGFYKREMSPLYFLLIHQSDEMRRYKLAPIIQKAMKDGVLHPEIGGRILDRYDVTNLGLEPSLNLKFILEDELSKFDSQDDIEMFFSNSPTYRSVLSDSIIQIYNANRSNIGLPNVDVFEYIYSKRPSIEMFKYIYNDIDIMAVSDSMELTKISRGMIKI